MNVYIVVDIEGISGVVKPEHTSVSGHLFNEGRRMMTEEINVCVKACKEAGVEKVYVADVHGGPDINALWLDLCEEADGYILGCGYNDPRRFPFVEECDAVISLDADLQDDINAIDEIRDHVVSSFNPGRSASAPSAATPELQATARETAQPSASGYVAPPQKWTCSKCGYRNEPNRITCKDCGTQK